VKNSIPGLQKKGILDVPRPKLTIGIACYDDFDGVYFTVQALRLFHAEAIRDCELVVVDNHPDSPAGSMVRDFLVGWVKGDVRQARYIPMPDVVGTSAPRDRVFREAAGDAVLCLDAHVLIHPGAIRRLIDYYDAHPDSRDLVSGPMVYDDLKNFATHFRDEWRAEMWGVWDTDIRGEDPNSEPIEIPAMGLGLFSCRKAAWLGFNDKFRGFGGEEFYIHEKFRQAGAKCLCLPFLRWTHRFGRPNGVQYPLTRWHKVRNYVLGHRELGLPLDPVKAHFVDGGLMSVEDWEAILADPDNPNPPVVQTASSCGGCGKKQAAAPERSLEELYDLAAKTPSDINEHCPKLRDLAAQCAHVTEFGMRHGVSTVALLAGQPKRFVSYDLKHDPIAEVLRKQPGNTDFEFRRGDSLSVDIDETDLLFIDTRHTADQLWAELDRHAGKVRRWIVLHDTQIFGEHGEDGGPGLLPALRRFLQANPEWSVVYHTQANHGLTVISRDLRDKPALPGKLHMAANFAKAIAGHIADGAAKVDRETLERRLETCSLCDQRTDDRCAVCGCYLAEKASWRSSDCPLGKWPTLETEQQHAA
jgi:hypothetical protein